MKKAIGYILLALMAIGYLYYIYLQQGLILGLIGVGISLSLLGLLYLIAWLIT